MIVFFGTAVSLILPEPSGRVVPAPELLKARRTLTRARHTSRLPHGTLWPQRVAAQQTLEQSNGRSTMKKTLWVPIMLALAALTAGCNTMEGMGEDIERGGEKIQQQAR